jgi:hypothetical protein
MSRRKSRDSESQDALDHAVSMDAPVDPYEDSMPWGHEEDWIVDDEG